MTKTVEQQVFDHHQNIAGLSQAGNNAKIALGEYLLWMREADRFKFVSGEDASWTDYLASPEVKIAYSTAARYMNIAQKYIKELGLSHDDLAGLDTWSLDHVAKLVTKKNVKDWLDKIRELSRSDIKHLARFGDTDQMTCAHEKNPDLFAPLPPKWECTKCGAITSRDPHKKKSV